MTELTLTTVDRRYKTTFLKQLAYPSDTVLEERLQRVEKRVNSLGGQPQLVFEVDVYWEGPVYTARAFIVMDSCNSSLVHMSNSLELGTQGEVGHCLPRSPIPLPPPLSPCVSLCLLWTAVG